MEYVELAGLRIAKPLYEFVNTEALPGTSIGADAFWSGFAGLLTDLAPRCKALLDKRDSIQQQIDAWHLSNKGKPADTEAYLSFLRGIGYLVDEPASCRCRTSKVDAEIATLAGPQLVVPVTNARYALNAANARWGSLYDALYGTDAIPEDGGAARGRGYNKVRGARGGRQGARNPRRGRAAAQRQPCGRHRLCGEGRRALGRAEGRRQHRLEGPGPVRRLSRRAVGAVRRAAEASRPASRDRDRPRPPDRQGRSGRALPM